MKILVEKIRSLVSPKKESAIPASIPFDLVKSKKNILRELMISKQSGNLIGVYCKAFGDGMFLTGVEDIETSGRSEVIVFNRYDMSGHILSRTRIELEEIRMVFPFNKSYLNPVFAREKSEKTYRLRKTPALWV